MRRNERQLDAPSARRVLNEAEFGVLSIADERGEPYGIPLNYCTIGEAVYFHCAREGKKVDILLRAPKVSFCAVGRTKILPDRFSTAYESAMVFGGAAEVHGDEKQRALTGLVEKYAPDDIERGRAYIDALRDKTRVFKISTDTVTGKSNALSTWRIRPAVEADFPEWLRMRQQLYPECAPKQLLLEIGQVFYDRSVVGELDYAVWVSEAATGGLTGFIEVSLRREIDGFETTPAPYIESLFVDPSFRRNGIAASLTAHAEAWTREKGCPALYVDTDPPLIEARRFYEKAGFTQIAETGEEILYRKAAESADTEGPPKR